MVRKYGESSVAVLTVTCDPKKGVLDGAEFLRKWDSFNSNVLAGRYRSMIRVIEATKSGLPHLHVVIALDWDCKSGTVLQPKGAPRWLVLKSYNRRLRDENCWLSAAAQRYGFGAIADIEPVKKNGEALAWYLAGYLSKSQLPPSWGNRRSYAFCGEVAKHVGSQFQWVSVGSWAFRRKLEMLADCLGFEDYEDFGEYLGRRWFWRLKPHLEQLKVPFFDLIRASRDYSYWTDWGREDWSERHWPGKTEDDQRAVVKSLVAAARELLQENLRDADPGPVGRSSCYTWVIPDGFEDPLDVPF